MQWTNCREIQLIMKLKTFYHIRNWPEQLILTNLSDGNLLKVISNSQYYPLTLIGYKKLCVAKQIYCIFWHKYEEAWWQKTNFVLEHN